MNTALRRIAFFVGMGLLFVSIYWSQDGFNFDMAGDSGYKTLALTIGWFLAVAVTVMEFVFSSSFRDLNPSLILFGIVAYIYSIYTNYGGVVHFQGLAQNNIGAVILAIIMDAVPEPLIAWGLYESKSGDFIGNIIKTVVSAPERVAKENMQKREPAFRSETEHRYIPAQPKKGEGRQELEKKYHFAGQNNGHKQEKPNRFSGFGE